MKKIGIIDSGLGGYYIASEIHKISSVDIVFLADQKYIPYGDKSHDEILHIMIHNIKWFQSLGIEEILIACNTASTVLGDLQKSFPKLKLYGVIGITAQQFENIMIDELLILGTELTIASHLYQEYLKSFLPNTKIIALSCPGLADLIEKCDFSVLPSYFDEHFIAYKNSKIPVLLACTHYSIIHDLFQNYFGGNYFDSVNSTQALFSQDNGHGQFDVYTSGNIAGLKKQLASLFQEQDIIIHKQESNE